MAGIVVRADDRHRALEERRLEELITALLLMAQLVHAAHGGRGSFRWCGESPCHTARALLAGVER
jgi:hypothetical protein